MKVTVCFGPVRVVVPCGDGDLTVRDLIRQATLRFRKATGKSSDSWVAVQTLQTSDGGILDPDDRLNDVVDDREQIIASYTDGDGPLHGGGDGASGSSVGTGSPDIFQGDAKYYNHTSDIEVTSEQLDQLITNPLQVRRGSEPALNKIEDTTGSGGHSNMPGPAVNNNNNKRWSAAAPIVLDSKPDKEQSKQNGYLHPDWSCREETEDKSSLLSVGKFERDGSNRLSMQFLNNGTGLRWMEAADKINNNVRGSSRSLPRDSKRREPLGQANSISPVPVNTIQQYSSSVIEEEANLENTNNVEYIVLRNENGPLGIHVVPDYDNSGRDRGLLVQGIEPGGRVHRDGRLAVYDRIIEINGSNLLNKPFHKVQEIFKNSLVSEELRLRVIKHESLQLLNNQRPPPPPPAPVYPQTDASAMVEGYERAVSSTKVATVSPTKKLPSGANTANILLSANTRKMGRRIDLELLKGTFGLGFSITTRDNPAGGNCPIYIKNILPKGAAVDDGRLRPGDRLLEVNGVEMTGKSQAEAVAVLREAQPGSIVKISVSRQEDVHHAKEDSTSSEPAMKKPARKEMSVDDSLPTEYQRSNVDTVLRRISEEHLSIDSSINSSPRKIEKSGWDESHIFPWRHREILTFDIPVHDTEKAGLGVSVKGKTSASHNGTTSSTLDLGIFVKSVLNGGAASRDGRLKTNDQLLSVNGKSLLNQSNSNAMETLRRAMLYTEGPCHGIITLTIARRIHSSLSSSSLLNTSVSSSDTVQRVESSEHSGASEASDSTVIFLPFKSKDLDNSENNYNDSSANNSTAARNPVIDRITGQLSASNNHNGLRNESYYRATHETTWNTSNMVQAVRGGKLNSPTVNPANTEPVLIEEDYQPNPVHNHSDRRLSQHQPDQQSQNKDTRPGPGDVTYASQLSLEESAAGFTRDAVGRQSMSEKRHAALDAKNTDTYRRNKKLRDERQHQQVKINSKIAEIRQELFRDRADGQKKSELGPYLGMKKSSSLESLQTMVQEMQMAEDPDPVYSYRNSQGAVRVIRGRGCNESFRAAVDRSYEAPLALRNQLETPVSDEELCQNECHLVARGAPRQSSMNAVRDSKLKMNKKKPGLLKGIGSMFRFGKHRKPMESGLQSAMEEEDEGFEERQKEEARIAAQEEHQKIQEQYRKLLVRQQQQQHVEKQFQGQKNDHSANSSFEHRMNHENRAQLAEDDQTPNTDRYSRELRNGARNYYQQQQQHHNKQTEEKDRSSIIEQRIKEFENRSSAERQVGRQEQNRGGRVEGRNKLYDNVYSQQQQQQQGRKFSLDSRNVVVSPAGSDYYQQQKQRAVLEEEDVGQGQIGSSGSRSQRIHQLRAQHQRKHVERRGQYPLEDREEKYEQAIRQRLDRPVQTEVKQHRRSSSYDIYGEMGRPGSRVGISDPDRFSHYVNYEEIQQHLNRRQQHYHSQRRDSREQHQRPVSNFYEYESVQDYPSRSVKTTINYLNSIANGNLTQQQNRKPGTTDVSNVRTRGPFISQITIKENPNES